MNIGRNGMTTLMKPFLADDVVESTYNELPLDWAAGDHGLDDAQAQYVKTLLDAVLLGGGDDVETPRETGAKRRKINKQ
jgi:hypothetical protein